MRPHGHGAHSQHPWDTGHIYFVLPISGGGGWATIGQVWTRHRRSSRACPTAFMALSVHHVFIRPLALLVFQTVPGPCLPGWGQGCGTGFWALPPGHTTHMILGPGRGVPCLGLPIYFGCACLRWPLLATHPWLCGLPRSWRARGATGQELAGLVAATNPGKSWWSIGLKSPSGYWSVGVSRHIQHSIC